MAVPPSQDLPLDPLLEYNMAHPRRGYFIIVNQVNFEKRTRQADRAGSDVDAARLETTFKRLGFDVIPVRNLSLLKLRHLLQEYSAKDHKNHDCFALALMSHGEKDIVYCTDGPMRVDEITQPFRADKCASLAGKPKLFFFQACRGFAFDDGMEVTDDANPDEEAESEKVKRLPIEADNFFFYSTPPGYFSWKNTAYGSWFMQELCRALDQWGDRHEFAQLMVAVQREVASGKHESLTDRKETSGKKQMPVSVSQLTRLLYFRPKPSSTSASAKGSAMLVD